jgi:hypothetical protein
MNSRRRYLIMFAEDNGPVIINISLDDLLDPKALEEYKYAAQEEVDDILDLMVGEVLCMRFNRDSAGSCGIIKRTN